MAKKKKPSLHNIVNDWLKVNRPEYYVEDGGSIGLVKEKDMQSQAFGVLTLGYVNREDVSFWNPNRKTIDDMFIEVKAADPEFFKKLAFYLK